MATIIDLDKKKSWNMYPYLKTGYHKGWIARYDAGFQVIIAKDNVFEEIKAKW